MSIKSAARLKLMTIPMILCFVGAIVGILLIKNIMGVIASALLPFGVYTLIIGEVYSTSGTVKGLKARLTGLLFTILPGWILYSILILIPAGQARSERDPYDQWIGKWQDPKGYLIEEWKMDGTSLVGNNYKVTGQDTSFLESLKVIKSDSGIFYIPTVFNQNDGKPIPFKKTYSDDSKFTFSNPQHDFPQTITYTFLSKDDLEVTIGGHNEGRYRESTFTFKRVTGK